MINVAALFCLGVAIGLLLKYISTPIYKANVYQVLWVLLPIILFFILIAISSKGGYMV